MHVWGTVAGPGPVCRAGRVGPGRGAGRADSESGRAAERPGGLRRDSPHPHVCGEGEADVRPTQQRATVRSTRIAGQTRVKAGTRSGHIEEERRTSGLTLQGAAL